MNPKEKPYNAVKETLDLLKRGDEVIDAWNRYEDAVVAVGLTGSGKSTATRLIMGDNSKLESYETKDGSYLIRDVVAVGDEDKRHISTSKNTIISKTIVPHLLVQPPFGTKSTPTAFYDCPGFSDTRSTAIEIANSYFTQRIADNSEQVKVLLVVDHNSLRTGKDRDDFILLLQHISNFFPNIDKFKNSFTLLANKAEQKRNDDKKLLSGIVDFLTNTKPNLKHVLKGNALENGIKIIDALLQQNESGDYKSITFLRVPEEAGLLSDIALIQENRQHIHNVLHNNTKYAITEPGDFGITLSPTAQNDILIITAAIDTKITALFSDISQLISGYFAQIAVPSYESSTGTSLNFEQQNLQHLPKYFELINNLPVSEDVSIQNNAVRVIKQILSPSKELLPVKISETILEDLLIQAKYIDIFLGFTKEFPSLQEQLSFIKPSEWISSLNEFLEEETILLKKASRELDDSFLNALEKNNDLIKDYFDAKFRDLIHLSDFSKELRKITTTLQDLKDLAETTRMGNENENPQAISSFIQTYLQLFRHFEQKSVDYNKTQGLFTFALQFYDLEDTLKIKTQKQTLAKVVQWQVKLQESSNVEITTMKGVVQKIEKERITSQMEKLCQEVISYFAQEFAKRDSQAGNFKSDKLEQLKRLKEVYNKIIQTQPDLSLSDFISKSGQEISTVINNTELLSIPSIKEEAENLDILRKIITKGIDIQIYFWFDPLKNLIADLEKTLEPEAYKPEFKTLGSQTIASIQGSFMSLKSIVEDKDLMSKIRSNNAKHIVIFSKHTIYIDTEFNMVDMSLSIISPIWVVSGNKQTIVVQGKDGAPPPDTENLDGQGLGGSPGSSGGSAGNFLGKGHHVVGGTLRVKSIGGVGGKGQNGGSGKNGKDGEEVDINKINFNIPTWEWRDSTNQVPQIVIRSSPYELKDTGYGSFHDDAGGILAAIYTYGIVKKYNHVYYSATSARGTNGQMGGKGGIGGEGGSKGEILIDFPENYKTFFSSESQDGLSGSNGMDGRNGADGRLGKDAELTFQREPADLFVTKYLTHDKIHTLFNSVRNSSEVKGQISTKIPFEKDKILELYRAFARTSSANPFHKISLSSFYPLLYGPSEKKLDDVLQEFYNLENQYQDEKSNLNFHAFYEMQVENIKRTLQSADFVTTQDEKKVLLYLYFASITRHNSFNKHYEPCLIIDMKSYLQLAQDNISKFKANARSEQILSMIQNTRNLFENENKDKLKEAERFINDIITPDILDLQKGLDSKVEVLLAEIEKLKSDTKTELRELEKKREELKRQMIWKGLLGVLKIGAGILSFLGPIGAGVGAAVGAAVGIGEAVAGGTGGTNNRPAEVRLPPAVTSASKQINNTLNQLHKGRVDTFVSKLSSIQTILKTDGGISKLYTKVIDAKEEILAAASKTNNQSIKEIEEFDQKIKTTENQIQGALESEIASLPPQTNAPAGSMNSNSVGTTPQILGKASNVLKSGIDLAKKLARNQKEGDEISLAISKAKKKLQDLHKFEKKVQDEMTSMLGEMHKDLEITMSEMSQRSAVSLDVGKWQIKRMLEDTKLFIREQFTGGFQVEPEMSRVMDKLSEGFSVLIQIYDRIQQIQEQSRVVNVIAEINSIPHTDFEKSPALQKLDGMIQGNVILKEYQLILNSLKMWGFPFAKFYLEDLQPAPESNQETNFNLKDLITVVGDNVEKLLVKVRTQKATVGSAMDVHIHKSRFDDAKSTPKPFYTWTYKEYKNVIEKFLEGKEVVFNADIVGLKSRRNAVKFNKIELALDLALPPEEKERNGTLTSELENYNVVLIHMGNSYYKYGHRFYTILSREIVFSFNFHSIHDGLPGGARNAVYEKVMEGDVMLSPYAMWKIKLEPVDPDRGFENLVSLLKDNLSMGYEPNLKLLGCGTYVSDGLEDDLMLDTYYTPHYF